MRRFFSLLVCLFLVLSTLAIPTNAANYSGQNEQVLISQTVEYVGDGIYYIESIYVPSVQPYSYSKTGTKTSACVSGGETIYAISVTGTFTYDGVTSAATSASGTIATYVPDATIKSRSAYTSGASAIATGSVLYYGFTLQKTVTLTCDKDGNLS